MKKNYRQTSEQQLQTKKRSAHRRIISSFQAFFEQHHFSKKYFSLFSRLFAFLSLLLQR